MGQHKPAIKLKNKVNMSLDICFSIETKNAFEDVTKEEVYEGLLKRLATLMKNWEPEAIGWVDEYEIED